MNIKLYILFLSTVIALPCVSIAEQSEGCAALNKASTEGCAALNKANSQSTAAACAASQKANAAACAASQKANAAASSKRQLEWNAASTKSQLEQIEEWFKTQSEKTAAWFKAQSETTTTFKARSEKTTTSIQKTDSLENANFWWESTKYSVGFILDLAPLEWFGGVPAYIGTTLPILEVIKGGNTIEKAQTSAQLFKDRNIQVIDELYSNRLNVRQTLDMEARTRFGKSVTWSQLTDDKKNQIIEYSGGWDDFLMSICGGYTSGCAGPKVVWDALGKP
jgi:hypothetical protein